MAASVKEIHLELILIHRRVDLAAAIV